MNTESVESWVADVLMAGMAELGFDTFSENESGFDAYIPEHLYSKDSLEELVQHTCGGLTVCFAAETIPATNWNEEWEKNYFKPLVVSDQIVVRAPFHTDYPVARYEIVIEPKMAFGTGNHETTSLMMEIMLESGLAGKSLLDMGCGTGILAILAALIGAGPVTAIDIDEWSYAATLENSQLNNTPQIKAVLGGADMLGPDRFDIILANIQKNVILDDLQKYVSVLNPGGEILLSGFYLNDLSDIRKEADRLGLVYMDHKERNNWTVVRFRG